MLGKHIGAYKHIEDTSDVYKYFYLQNIITAATKFNLN